MNLRSSSIQDGPRDPVGPGCDAAIGLVLVLVTGLMVAATCWIIWMEWNR